MNQKESSVSSSSAPLNAPNPPLFGDLCTGRFLEISLAVLRGIRDRKRNQRMTNNNNLFIAVSRPILPRSKKILYLYTQVITIISSYSHSLLGSVLGGCWVSVCVVVSSTEHRLFANYHPPSRRLMNCE